MQAASNWRRPIMATPWLAYKVDALLLCITQGCSVPDRDGLCRPMVRPCRNMPGQASPPDPSLLLASSIPHFYWQGPGQPGPHRPARPPNPHFYFSNPSLLFATPSLPLASPSLLGARLLTSMARPSLLFARTLTSNSQPLTSIGLTPHFYLPDLSLLSARPLTSIS